jgi:signal transduction histidine kinase
VTHPPQSDRRNPLGYLAVLRGGSSYQRLAQKFHTALALVALLLVAFSDHAVIGVPFALLALSGPVLNFLMTSYDRGSLRAWPVLPRIAESIVRTEGRHQLSLPALLEILGLVALVAVFSWVVTDLPVTVRLIGLLLAVALTLSVAHAIYSDHTWYNPAESDPPRWQEALRAVAGMSTAALVACVALPGDWTGPQRGAVAVIAALPLVVGVRVRDLDEVVSVLGGIVVDEERRGRQLVVDEIDRALSRPLADLERLARQHPSEPPVLLELAVHARSRLQETLAATEHAGQHPPTVDELLGPVLTLARAVGIAVEVDLSLGALSPSGVETTAWVLRDLVGNAINAGSSVVRVTARLEEDSVVVDVLDDAAPVPPGVWKVRGTSSARLEHHLIMLGGGLEMRQLDPTKVVTARFLERQGSTPLTAGGDDERAVGQNTSGGRRPR